MFNIYEWVTHRGKGVISNWTLEKSQQAKLDKKIHLVAQFGIDLGVGLVSCIKNDLYVLKIKGDFHLRPVFCRDPHDENGFTFLVQVTEKGNQYRPGNYEEIAEERREEIIKNKESRTLIYE